MHFEEFEKEMYVSLCFVLLLKIQTLPSYDQVNTSHAA